MNWLSKFNNSNAGAVLNLLFSCSTHTVDAVDYCSANRADIVPTTDNCAEYFNCSKLNTSIGDHVVECHYPDLFSVRTLSCESFETVQCNTRLEPQAPCKYGHCYLFMRETLS